MPWLDVLTRVLARYPLSVVAYYLWRSHDEGRPES